MRIPASFGPSARHNPGVVSTVRHVTATHPHNDDPAPAVPPTAALRELVGLILVLTGVGAVLYGAWMLGPAAAVITGGLLALAVGSAMTTRRVDE